jgi:ElaB/YqjD/DUF883 family membrane-anchored ribosome-binding protein
MTPTAAPTQHREAQPDRADRILDACTQGAHLSHEVRRLRTIAEDAIEDGMYAAKRTMKSVRRGAERLIDLTDRAAYQVKRRPLRAVGAALGVGMVLGIGIGWIASRSGRRV